MLVKEDPSPAGEPLPRKSGSGHSRRHGRSSAADLDPDGGELRALPGTRHGALLVVVFLVALLMRGFPLFQYDYPTGADYGHHTYYAELYVETGELPESFPYYQLGGSRWSILPGGALTYAILSAFSGRPAFDLARITAVLGVIEAAGVYLLAWRVFRRWDAALTASLVTALLPSGALMTCWSAYANLIALSLMPFAFTAWLDYWDRPGASTLLVAALTISGTAAVHHLSTLWLGSALLLFSLIHVAMNPRDSIKRLLPIGAVGALVGLPILWRVVELVQVFDGRGAALPEGRFDATRIDWSHWSQTASAPSLLFLTGGMLSFFFMRQLRLSHRVLMASYLMASLGFGFGWLVGIDFYYTRAIYFLSLPMALGAAALLFLWKSSLARALTSSTVLLSLGIGTLFQSQAAAAYYEALTPAVMEGVDWLAEFSKPDDVVVVGTFLGFHMPRLLHRPIMVALTPDLVGNPDDIPVAADAVRILMGLHDMDAALERRNVKFIMVRARGIDVPDRARSRAVLSAHPRIHLLFGNSDILIYGVEPL